MEQFVVTAHGQRLGPLRAIEHDEAPRGRRRDLRPQLVRIAGESDIAGPRVEQVLDALEQRAHLARRLTARVAGIELERGTTVRAVEDEAAVFGNGRPK